MNRFLRIFRNVQILSALIWALTIILCSWVSDKNDLVTLLITAAGFHVILLAQSERLKQENTPN